MPQRLEWLDSRGAADRQVAGGHGSYLQQHRDGEKRERLGRTRLLDSLLADRYRRAGVARIASNDWRDFARYGVFNVEHV